MERSIWLSYPALLILVSLFEFRATTITSNELTNDYHTVQNIAVECLDGAMDVRIAMKSTDAASDASFSGLVYPRGLARNSPCMLEYMRETNAIHYRLPLRSCNTMSAETDDGHVEYFNTIVVQPHLKLVTNQGKAFHVRCKYQNYDEVISFSKKEQNQTDPQRLSTEEIPRVTMRIFHEDKIAENVKIGDPLTLTITLDKQKDFGLQVSDCLVRDGIGWSEQRLINPDGCPIDGEIMGNFVYNEDRTKAQVQFQAHKFPYTQSVYYQCNVKLCSKADGSCDNITPPICGKNRGRRQATADGVPATVELYSGLYVHELNDMAKSEEYDEVIRKRKQEGDICIAQKTFAYAICIAGFILIVLVLLALIILVMRRSSRKSVSGADSSIYSGPYTNTAYSHSS